MRPGRREEGGTTVNIYAAASLFAVPILLYWTISEVFTVLFRLIGLPEEQYVDFLAALAAKASVTGEEEILLNARDRAAVGGKVVEAANARLSGGKLTLAEDCGEFAGGLILRRGNVEANCTAELLVELCRGEMSSELAGMLFEQ